MRKLTKAEFGDASPRTQESDIEPYRLDFLEHRLAYLESPTETEKAWQEHLRLAKLSELELEREMMSVRESEAPHQPYPVINAAPRQGDEADLLWIEGLVRRGCELVESAICHVSHGGPTIAEAKAWLHQADLWLKEKR